jgi:hypothetical protein
MKVAALLIALLLAAAPTQAGEPARKPDPQVERQAKRKAQAIQLEHRANAAMRARRYKKAFDLLKERLAVVTEADADAHYNLIQLAKARRSCPDVLLHVQLYLAQSEDDPDEKELRREMKRCMPHKKRRALLSLSVKPEGATVWLDGVPATPLLGKKIMLHAGKHKVRAELTDHHDRVETLEIEKGEKTHDITLKEMTFYGTLEVKTEPAGATVSVDGKELGPTPLAPTELTEGKHRIELRKEGFDLFMRNISIGRNEPYLFETKLFRPGEKVDE